MDMELRIASLGFNSACGGMVQGLISSPGASVVGILMRELPREWPPSLDPPPLFSSRKELFRAGKPNLLLVAEDVGEIKGVPSKCQVMQVQKELPVAQLLEALAIRGSVEAAPDQELQKIASL